VDKTLPSLAAWLGQCCAGKSRAGKNDGRKSRADSKMVNEAGSRANCSPAASA